ncbi:hypothetical protein TPA0908_15940 [Micromonospora sp. AKA38]|nr:hypothetical protein TPA0908_15940 [Micromonospora sp. AKA38]
MTVLDGQVCPVTMTTLDGAAAGDQRGQEAVTNAANVLAQAPDGHRPAVDGHHRPRAPQMWEAGSASGAPGSYASTPATPGRSAGLRDSGTGTELAPATSAPVAPTRIGRSPPARRWPEERCA